MKYGDVVLLVIGDKEIPAFVLQSLVHPITDKEGNFLKDAEGNFSSPTEHLTVAYPDPGKGVEIMSGEQVQGAIKFLFSVTPWKFGQHIGFVKEGDFTPAAILSEPAGMSKEPVVPVADFRPEYFSVDDAVLGCKVEVKADEHFLQAYIGSRDHCWNRATGEHVGSGSTVSGIQPVPPTSDDDPVGRGSGPELSETHEEFEER